ncbi:MAG: PEP-CTERM sorting domain-containing protein [Fimbriiglobus sp.]
MRWAFGLCWALGLAGVGMAQDEGPEPDIKPVSQVVGFLFTGTMTGEATSFSYVWSEQGLFGTQVAVGAVVQAGEAPHVVRWSQLTMNEESMPVSSAPKYEGEAAPVVDLQSGPLLIFGGKPPTDFLGYEPSDSPPMPNLGGFGGAPSGVPVLSSRIDSPAEDGSTTLTATLSDGVNSAEGSIVIPPAGWFAISLFPTTGLDPWFREVEGPPEDPDFPNNPDDPLYSVGQPPAATPEPATVVLAGLGIVGVLARRRMRTFR